MFPSPSTNVGRNRPADTPPFCCRKGRPMLQLINIEKKYTTGDLTQAALNGVSLNLRDSEFVAILGPSGSGKTTLLNIIGGLDRYDNGELIINGISTRRYTDRDWDSYRNHTVGFVFQSYNLIPHQTVLANVELALTISGVSGAERRRRAAEALRQVGLGDQLHKRPTEMSGGQMQRVAIARALVTGPAIICMDEPLSNLDAKLRVQLRNELKKMQKDFGITTIYVTHDQEEALTLSDRIAVFNKGFIEQIGTPNEVYNHSQTEFVCNFIGDINRLNDDTVSALRAAGAEVDASKHNYIRLERLHVNVAPRGGEIALDGTVENCEYYGLYIKYYIHVGTQSLKVIEKNDGVNIYDPGQRVKVILNPNDIMAYAPSAEEVE